MTNTHSENTHENVNTNSSTPIALTQEELHTTQTGEENNQEVGLKTFHGNVTKDRLERLIHIMGETELPDSTLNQNIKVVHNISVTVKDGKATITDYPLKKV